MELLLIRHAEPEWVRDGKTVDDPDLTERGHRQASHLAERLAGERFDHLWVSDAQRARSTARPLEKALGMEATVHDWLHEVRTPALAGRDAKEVASFLEDRRQFPVPAWWEGFPGCEPVRDFVRRVSEGLDGQLEDLGANRRIDGDVELWNGLPDARIAVVCHSGTAGAAISHLLGLRHVPWPWERFGLLHAALAHMAALKLAGAQAFTLSRFQDTAHLPSDHHTS